MSHEYGPHSSGSAIPLPQQLENSPAYRDFIERMTLHTVSLVKAERERCAKILDSALVEERAFASSKDWECRESASYAVTALELLVSRIRSGE